MFLFAKLARRHEWRTRGFMANATGTAAKYTNRPFSFELFLRKCLTHTHTDTHTLKTVLHRATTVYLSCTK
jgi:hypothetical protein